MGPRGPKEKLDHNEYGFNLHKANPKCKAFNYHWLTQIDIGISNHHFFFFRKIKI